MQEGKSEVFGLKEDLNIPQWNWTESLIKCFTAYYSFSTELNSVDELDEYLDSMKNYKASLEGEIQKISFQDDDKILLEQNSYHNERLNTLKRYLDGIQTMLDSLTEFSDFMKINVAFRKILKRTLEKANISIEEIVELSKHCIHLFKCEIVPIQDNQNIPNDRQAVLVKPHIGFSTKILLHIIYLIEGYLRQDCPISKSILETLQPYKITLYNQNSEFLELVVNPDGSYTELSFLMARNYSMFSLLEDFKADCKNQFYNTLAATAKSFCMIIEHAKKSSKPEEKAYCALSTIDICQTLLIKKDGYHLGETFLAWLELIVEAEPAMKDLDKNYDIVSPNVYGRYVLAPVLMMGHVEYFACKQIESKEMKHKDVLRYKIIFQKFGEHIKNLESFVKTRFVEGNHETIVLPYMANVKFGTDNKDITMQFFQSKPEILEVLKIMQERNNKILKIIDEKKFVQLPKDPELLWPANNITPIKEVENTVESSEKAFAELMKEEQKRAKANTNKKTGANKKQANRRNAKKKTSQNAKQKPKPEMAEKVDDVEGAKPIEEVKVYTEREMQYIYACQDYINYEKNVYDENIGLRWNAVIDLCGFAITCEENKFHTLSFSALSIATQYYYWEGMDYLNKFIDTRNKQKLQVVDNFNIKFETLIDGKKFKDTACRTVVTREEENVYVRYGNDVERLMHAITSFEIMLARCKSANTAFGKITAQEKEMAKKCTNFQESSLEKDTISDLEKEVQKKLSELLDSIIRSNAFYAEQKAQYLNFLKGHDLRKNSNGREQSFYTELQKLEKRASNLKAERQ